MERKILIGLALTLIIVIFIPVYLINEPARQRAALARQTHEKAEIGAHQYAATCALCHGENGEGLVGPPLYETKLSEEALERSISRGGEVMPAWAVEDGGPLKKHEIHNLVTFIKNWDNSLLDYSTTEPEATHAPAPEPGPASEGRKIFEGLQCVVCHKIDGDGAGLGPPLVGLFGSERELESGEKVVADEAYVVESITEPTAKIAKGFPGGVMPPQLKLSQEQLDALVAFIKSLSG